jgi:hypothetical protein
MQTAYEVGKANAECAIDDQSGFSGLIDALDCAWQNAYETSEIVNSPEAYEQARRGFVEALERRKIAHRPHGTK